MTSNRSGQTLLISEYRTFYKSFEVAALQMTLKWLFMAGFHFETPRWLNLVGLVEHWMVSADHYKETSAADDVGLFMLLNIWFCLRIKHI